MKTAVLILALFAFLQGPVCPMSAFAAPAKAAGPSSGHDCCPGGEAPDAAPGQQGDSAAMAACAAHCASLAQAVAIAPTFMMDTALVPACLALQLGSEAPITGPLVHAGILPHGRPSLQTIPLLI